MKYKQNPTRKIPKLNLTTVLTSLILSSAVLNYPTVITLPASSTGPRGICMVHDSTRLLISYLNIDAQLYDIEDGAAQLILQSNYDDSAIREVNYCMNQKRDGKLFSGVQNGAGKPIGVFDPTGASTVVDTVTVISSGLRFVDQMWDSGYILVSYFRDDPG